MSTGQSIINRSLRLLGVIASGESPTAQESADALEALNQMLASWRIDRLSVYASQVEQLPLVAGTATYTIGPSGDLNTNRPIRIEDAYIRITTEGRDYPLTIVDIEQWAALPDKSLTDTYPDWLLYVPSTPLGQLTLYPVPAVASTLNLVTWVVLETITLAGTLTLPPGYERAIAYNLALDLAPEYEKEVPKAVAIIAVDALAAVKRANNSGVLSHKDLHLLVGDE